MVQPRLRWDSIEPTLATGDIVLFHSHRRPINRMIELVGGSRFSHVGMVTVFGPGRQIILGPGVQVRPGPDVYLWEAIPRSDFRCALGDKHRHKGVQLNPLADVVTGAGGLRDVCIRKLSPPLQPPQLAKFDEFLNRADRTLFSGTVHILVDQILGRLHVACREQTFFCSELVAETYIQMGVLSPHPPANRYMPGHFSQATLKLAWPWSLGNQQCLDLASVAATPEA